MYELTIYRRDGTVYRSQEIRSAKIRTIEHAHGVTVVYADGWDDKHGFSIAPKESGNWMTLSHISPDGEVLGVLFDSREAVGAYVTP